MQFMHLCMLHKVNKVHNSAPSFHFLALTVRLQIQFYADYALIHTA